MRFYRTLALGAAITLAGCGEQSVEHAGVVYEKTDFSNIAAWSSTNVAGIHASFLNGCKSLIEKKPSQNVGSNAIFGTYADWHRVCQRAEDLEEEDIKSFFEQYFTPYKIISPQEGLFTGYYTPELEGRLEPDESFSTPLRAKPADMVEADLGSFVSTLAGQRIVGKVERGRLTPYPTRAEIETRETDPTEVVVWVKDPIEKFFLQIQGSGRVKLADERAVSVVFSASNGRPYTAIGKTLLEQGVFTKPEDISMGSIKNWLIKNPDKQNEIFETNQRYIFFRLSDALPRGSLGQQLTPYKSLAVDPTFVPLGAPVIVNTYLSKSGEPFNKVMIAEDVGSAIIGANRGDIYFGIGKTAEDIAGPQKAAGNMVVLLPKL